jgi:hypothetical protein
MFPLFRISSCQELTTCKKRGTPRKEGNARTLEVKRYLIGQVSYKSRDAISAISWIRN